MEGPSRGGAMGRPDRAAVRALLERIREDAPITRRDYLRILVTVSGGLLIGTGAVALGAFRRHGAGTGPPRRVAARLPRGRAVYFSFPGPDDQAIAVRLADGRLVAYSAICTHLACAVLWRPDREDLYCPCHDGVFDAATGAVLAGPPPRPLPRVIVEERPDGIFAVATAEDPGAA
ncbi:MAG TPA: Rieske (2Fe-2S) protein [Actinomycetota bacterium]|nr:Rieske (2Fe-2S) protein [Actinomycetota bacterium]